MGEVSISLDLSQSHASSLVYANWVLLVGSIIQNWLEAVAVFPF